MPGYPNKASINPRVLITPRDFWFAQFTAQLKNTVATLNKLLAVKSPKDAASYKTLPVAKLIQEITESIDAGQKHHATLVWLMLAKLVEDLGRIQKSKPKLFRHYRKRMKTGGSAEYRGTRFEIGTASALIRNSIEFSIPQLSSEASPDFILETEQGKLKLECSAPQLRTASSEDLLYKITAKLKEKSEKSYADATTIVMLDVTDLIYSRPGCSIIHKVTLRSEVVAFVSTLPIASALIVFYALETGYLSQKISRIYLRCDNPAINPLPKAFLDKLYPITGSYRLLDTHAFPSQP